MLDFNQLCIFNVAAGDYENKADTHLKNTDKINIKQSLHMLLPKTVTSSK